MGKGKFQYTQNERNRNKVLKYNQDLTNQILNDHEMASIRAEADQNIESTLKLLSELGHDQQITKIKEQVKNARAQTNKPLHVNTLKWDDIVLEAEKTIKEKVILEDLLSQEEMDSAIKRLDKINSDFSHLTGIINKVDLSFLAIATALQVTKSLLFPYVAHQFDYGKGFDPSQRMDHNDPFIKQQQKNANKRFKDSNLKSHNPGHWINLLFQTPPYDTTVGSAYLNINMGGRYHRLYTLGHDPILGWIFGTANILTDTITLNNFQSYRVSRVPKLHITSNAVNLITIFQESYNMIESDFLNLPAALFAQAHHLKSDAYTKIGLPPPIIPTINENFASTLYREQYDALCLARDTKIISISYFISSIIDMIIGLIHSCFKKGEESSLYEIRTRKILLISNLIATNSSIIAALLTKNFRDFDIASLISSIIHLFFDVKFITRIKSEFIENALKKDLHDQLDEINALYGEIFL